jgi:hypothetical protein
VPSGTAVSDHVLSVGQSCALGPRSFVRSRIPNLFGRLGAKVIAQTANS